MKTSFCKKILFIALILFVTLSAMAQDTGLPSTEENGFMRSEGKIYVVMIVVITILAGLILYVFRLDKKLSKLEKGDSL